MSYKDRRHLRTEDREGFRVPKHKSRETHADHLKEKRLVSALRSKHVEDFIDEEDNLDDPHWLYRDED